MVRPLAEVVSEPFVAVVVPDDAIAVSYYVKAQAVGMALVLRLEMPAVGIVPVWPAGLAGQANGGCESRVEGGEVVAAGVVVNIYDSQTGFSGDDSEPAALIVMGEQVFGGAASLVPARALGTL